MRVDGAPASEDAVGAATAIKDASLDGGKRAGDIFKGFCAAMSIILKGHHCWVLRAFASAFAHRRACRRSHVYSGDPFDPRRLLTVALYDNCSSQIALASACQRAALWDLANCETWYSKTRGRVGSIFRPATPHPKESWRRRGAVQLASRTAHTRRQRNSTDRRLWHSLSVPAAPVRGTNHDV